MNMLKEVFKELLLQIFDVGRGQNSNCLWERERFTTAGVMGYERAMYQPQGFGGEAQREEGREVPGHHALPAASEIVIPSDEVHGYEEVHGEKV